VSISADMVMTLGGVVFVTCVIPQIVRTYKLKSAKELSWLFLSLLIVGLMFILAGKLILKCHMSAVMDIVMLFEYFVLMYMKARYERREIPHGGA
jgi:uncharacterized protein with PQ loop repeat